MAIDRSGSYGTIDRKIGGGSVTGGPTRKALDLFSGSKSITRRLRELGFEVISLDINPHY